MKFYDSNGAAVAYLDADGETIYAWGGKPLGYLSGDNIYAFGGEHLGWFEDGWIIDHAGGHSFFTDRSVGGPVLPYKQFEAFKGFKEFLPFKGYQAYAPYKPYRSTGWGKNIFA